MSLSIIIAFWGVALLFIITPGADWAYIISAGVSGRFLTPAIAGLIGGHFIAAIVVAAGVGALVASTPAALSALIIAGAAYLLWLGIGILRHPSVPQASHNRATHSWGQWVLKGLFTSGLNSKVFLLFLALLPQFTDPHARWPVPVQMIVLGLVHLVTCSIIYTILGNCSRAALQTRPHAARLVSQISGGLMIVIAILLLAEQFYTGK